MMSVALIIIIAKIIICFITVIIIENSLYLVIISVVINLICFVIFKISSD